jgi:hypothetical protein
VTESGDIGGALARLLAAARANAGRPRQPPPPRRGEVFCRSCRRLYPVKELQRRSWSGPGMRRPGGGPTGAWREVWKCCPRGHRVIRLGFRIS